jgi:uncharacterized protein YbjT (DUF2867 family)
MTYAVAGASGHTGAAIATALLDRGEKVRVIVRDPAKGERFAARGAEVVVADLEDATAVERAFADVEGAFVLVPPNLGAKDFRAYQRKVVDAIARAAEATKLPHLVLLSSVGAQHSAGNGPIAGLHEAEQRFRRLPATKSTFIRAASFHENVGGALATLEQGFIVSFMLAGFAWDMIATSDIAKLATTALLEGAKETTVIELGGPAVSYEEIAKHLSELVGRPVRVQEAPLSAIAPTFESFGMSPSLAALYQELMTGISTGHVVFEGGHRRVHGTTSVKTVLAQLLQA